MSTGSIDELLKKAVDAVWSEGGSAYTNEIVYVTTDQLPIVASQAVCAADSSEKSAVITSSSGSLAKTAMTTQEAVVVSKMSRLALSRLYDGFCGIGGAGAMSTGSGTSSIFGATPKDYVASHEPSNTNNFCTMAGEISFFRSTNAVREAFSLVVETDRRTLMCEVVEIDKMFGTDGIGITTRSTSSNAAVSNHNGYLLNVTAPGVSHENSEYGSEGVASQPGQHSANRLGPGRLQASISHESLGGSVVAGGSSGGGGEHNVIQGMDPVPMFVFAVASIEQKQP